MGDKEKQQLKSNLKSRLDYFYAKLDNTYHIPNNVEGWILDDGKPKEYYYRQQKTFF